MPTLRRPAHRWDPVPGAGRGAVAGVPEGYAPWQMLYRWFRRWQRDGTWATVLTRRQTVADEGDDGSAGEGGEVGEV